MVIKHPAKSILRLSIAAYFLFQLNSSIAQTPKVSIDNKLIKIGQQTKLTIQLDNPTKGKLNWPIIKDSIGKIEIVKASGIDTISDNNGKSSLRQSFTITSFDSGRYSIPPITFEFPDETDSVKRYLSTDSIFLDVQTIACDTTKAIKDIKEPMKEPITFKEMLPWILGGLLSIGLIIGGIILYKRYKRNEPLIALSRKQNIAPHEAALTRLEQIRIEKLWQNGKTKEYHTAVTDVLRDYLDKQFDINALEMTTEEITTALVQKHFSAEVINTITPMLKLADMVKFAKAEPLPNEHDQSLQSCIEFIKKTMPTQKSADTTELSQNNNN